MSMEPPQCPVHPDAAAVPVLRGRDQFWGLGDDVFTYCACSACGTWLLRERPEPAALGTWYGGYYSDDELDRWTRAIAKRGPRAVLKTRLHAGELQECAEAAGVPIAPGARVLDVGAGLGHFLAAARELWGAGDVRGVDSSERCRAFAQATWKVNIDVGELASQRYGDASFDVVAIRHCLEHVYDPARELSEIARVLRPAGLLEVEVPTPGLLARLFRGRWVFLQPPTHFFHVTAPTLHALLDRAGFDVVATRWPWSIGELAGSVLCALGVKGVAPRVLFPKKRNPLVSLALVPLGVVDLVVTRVLAALAQSGTVRVLAKKRSS
jgi:ubiquinone/menaquinone biosynthesis C-methylase UbiE